MYNEFITYWPHVRHIYLLWLQCTSRFFATASVRGRVAYRHLKHSVYVRVLILAIQRTPEILKNLTCP